MTEADTDWGDDPEQSQEAFGLSYLDLISGGFAAVFFLFLIFTTFPFEINKPDGGAERVIEAWLTWPDETAVYELIIEYKKRGGEKRIYRISGKEFKNNNEIVSLSYQNQPPKFWRALDGMGLYNEPALEQVSMENKKMGTWLRFMDPCPGDYKVRINRNYRGGGALTNRAEAQEFGNWELRIAYPYESGQMEKILGNELSKNNAEITPLIHEFIIPEFGARKDACK